MPSGLEVIFLADRGFVHPELFRWLRRQQWHYRVRLTADTLIHFPDRRVIPVGQWVLAKGAAHFYHGVHLLGVALAQLDQPNQDPWLLVSDDFTDLTTFDEYGLRFDLEENFLDDKSNGFQVEASRLDTPAALERLVLVLAIATPQTYETPW